MYNYVVTEVCRSSVCRSLERDPPRKGRAPTSAGLQRWAGSCFSLCLCVTLSFRGDVFSLSSSAMIAWQFGNGASRGARKDASNFQE